MIDPQLLDILVCPETHQPVAPADESFLSKLNASIESGGVVNRGGAPVDAVLEGALVREDGRVAYPVREDIPVMLIDESIELASEASSEDGASA